MLSFYVTQDIYITNKRRNRRMFIHSWIERAIKRGEDQQSNHHIPFTGRVRIRWIEGDKNLKICGKIHGIRFRSLVVDIRNGCVHLSSSPRITNSLLPMEMLVNFYLVPFLFRTGAVRAKNARDESIQHDNWEKSRLFDEDMWSRDIRRFLPRSLIKLTASRNRSSNPGNISLPCAASHNKWEQYFTNIV